MSKITRISNVLRRKLAGLPGCWRVAPPSRRRTNASRDFTFHADVYGRRGSDYFIPSYPYLFPSDPAPPFNGKQPNSSFHSEGQAVGGSYLFDGGYMALRLTLRLAGILPMVISRAPDTSAPADTLV